MTAAPISVKALAERLGVDRAAVQKAMRTGRLERSLGVGANGRPIIVDSALAEQEWQDNRDPSRERGSTAVGAPPAESSDDPPQERRHTHGGTIADERKRLIRAQTRRVELENAKREGKLIDADEAERRWTGLVVEASVTARGLPTRARQRLPHLSVADVLVLGQLIEEMLDGLAAARESVEAAPAKRPRRKIRTRTRKAKLKRAGALEAEGVS